jgi:hydrogenase maturation protein HypF
VAYEGQAAILLEYESERYLQDPGVQLTEMQIDKQDNIWVLSATDLVRSLLIQKMDGTASGRLGAAFHHELTDGLYRIVTEISNEQRIKKVALSGGCFQNMILLHGLVQRLEQSGLKVYINHQVPANDGGISLGQAYWGMHNV